MVNASPLDALDLLKKGTVTCHTEELLLARLRAGKPLRVKAGFDPTAPDLHLGHGVLLRKMAQFQELGHTVIFLIGDFTGLIGDPTGKKATRPPLTREEVLANAETYKTQVFKVLDPALTEIRFNSEWMGGLHGEDWIRLASRFTLAQMLERNDFQKRMNANEPIALHELLYPLVQAYDSVALECDVELGGNDQLFNLMKGRDLQAALGQPPQVVLTVPLLLGLDGVEKMSKSLGNYIGFMEDADTQFGKAMSISDENMWSWWLLLTDLLPREIEVLKQGHPMDAKKGLAREIVSQFHGREEGLAAQERWVKRFSERRTDDAPEVEVAAFRGESLAKLLAERGMAPSRKEAERLIQQGAVSLDGVKVQDPRLAVDLAAGQSLLVKAGKLKLQRWVVR
ncbi:tyrosine--tRNA ligase [Mesoterricola silvestris]|uniref:Tyrosine--tRNA ligase n=1 Tax=Mesoterricola silvestris TaxID=2927979 RepID=A0AA48GL14_9BACT|nr:tyrosine--tRNA ligase [Mesoterricola silvestris]BDU71729.1 tyrosine--tRNA ligase [Mesoterricola silvestris]